MKTVIQWFRRDLRVSDNTALSEACKRAETVIPVFIFEDALRTGPDVGAARLEFLLQSVESLRKNLAELGHTLIIRCGKSADVLPALCQEAGAQAVFANKRHEPYTQRRDERITSALLDIGVGFELFKDAVIWEEQEILNQSGKPYTVFTPYSKAWKARPVSSPRPRIKNLKLKIKNLPGDALPADTASFGHPLTQKIPPGGERTALELLRKFMAGPVYSYGTNRNFPAVDGGSNLSPHLRAGTIGIRTILAALKKAREKAAPAQAASCDVYLNELIWREFYTQVLHNFPHVTKGAFRPEYNQLKWSDNREHFQAWCEGRTGYPIVDAAMRCLNATGTMHNRLRMIVAMFLTKDLLINWQLGERHFMQQLVDGDMAANNGGWQWSAGTGTDAAPYFRIFNPTSQAEKCDENGEFVRRWLPELKDFPDDLIHQPWENPLLFAKSKYPARIVLHEEQRDKCLAMFKAIKG
ncbi:MAG TPA: deoxyribodipyrimidine photo-lyase [Candidatus Acidoferrales bacterium]|jgi:deoxyribodipyrimidine photo-lyase|nr:deoxyribodipyrimidine photo-lyase [Candidatus Acidoferrales bacterium]